MLSEAIGNLLPAAVGVGLSPIPIVAVILMLGTPKARSNGPAFAIGWVLGLTVVCVVVLAVAGGADDPDSTTSDSVHWLQIALGLAFLAMARRQWKKRPKRGEAPTMPKWMETVDRFTPGRSFVFGVLLSAVNPKNLALTLAAGAAIAQAGLSAADDAIAVAVFVVIGSVSVAGLVVFSLLGGKHATRPLASIKEFMEDHNAVIMMIVLLVLGAKLLGDGLPQLF